MTPHHHHHFRPAHLGPLPADDLVPMPNDRHFVIDLRNRGRSQNGTATIARLLALYRGIAQRYPKWRKSPQSSNRMVITIRPRIGGPVIAKITPMIQGIM